MLWRANATRLAAFMILVAVAVASCRGRVACSAAAAPDLLDDGVAFHCVGACDTPAPRSQVNATLGHALCGGHMYPGVTITSDLDMYRWLLTHGDGGDALVLTADSPPCDIYNPLLLNLSGLPQGKKPNSVTTACFTSRSGSSSARLAALLTGASTVFITGGDQSLYYKYWRDSAVSNALPKIPALGGSSAGLAVQGEFVYDALGDDSVTSEEALKHPTSRDITLTNDLFKLDWMTGVLTDTHFYQRDRMGRFVTFLARVVKAGWAPGNAVLGVAISEHTAVLIDGATGEATVSGVGPAYFAVPPRNEPAVCKDGEPLTYEGLQLWRWNSSSAGATADSTAAVFSFKTWSPTAAGRSVLSTYNISAVRGKLESTQPGGGIY